MNRNEVSLQQQHAMSLDSVTSFSTTDGMRTGHPSQQNQQSMESQRVQNQFPIPREQTCSMNEGPSILKMIQSTGQSSLSTNDPNLRMFDPSKKGQYALQVSRNVSYLANPASMEHGGTAINNGKSISGSSNSTDIYTANDRCYSSPEMTLRQQQVHVPNSHPKSMPYYVLHKPVPPSGSGLTEFYNAEPYQLQMQHDSRSAGPSSLASRPNNLHLAQHDYENFPVHQDVHDMQPQNQCGNPVSMVSHASTEELNNERNKELEKSLESMRLQPQPEETLVSTKMYEVGKSIEPLGLVDGSVKNYGYSTDSDPNSSFALTTLSSDSVERSRCLPNTQQDNQINVSRVTSTSSDLSDASAQNPAFSVMPQQQSSLPVMSAAVSPQPTHGTSAPPSLAPNSTPNVSTSMNTPNPTPDVSTSGNACLQGNISQEISHEKIKKGGLLPMPTETGDTEEMCESDLQDFELE